MTPPLLTSGQDPHPGNILVDCTTATEGSCEADEEPRRVVRPVLLDWGMSKTLSTKTKLGNALTVYSGHQMDIAGMTDGMHACGIDTAAVSGREVLLTSTWRRVLGEASSHDTYGYSMRAGRPLDCRSGRDRAHGVCMWVCIGIQIDVVEDLSNIRFMLRDTAPTDESRQANLKFMENFAKKMQEKPLSEGNPLKVIVPEVSS